METTFLYAPDDEVEARAIEALLRDAGVRFSIRANADTAYPGVLDMGRGWGEIRVHPDDLEDAQNLVADWLESEPVEGEVDAAAPIEPSRPARSVMSLLPWAVLAISLLANWYQWDRHRLRLGEQDVYDAEGTLVAKYVFRDSVEFATELTIFGRAGERVQRCIDRDVNGWFEECFYYAGERRLHDDDADEDGRYESSELLEGDERVARWTDTDGDGLFDRFVDRRGGRGEDTDSDGMPDTWQCTDGRSVNLVTCAAGDYPGLRPSAASRRAARRRRLAASVAFEQLLGTLGQESSHFATLPFDARDLHVVVAGRLMA